MRKILSTLSFATLIAVQANAQNISFSPEIGLTYNTISHTVNAEKRTTGYQFGFRTGCMADFQFGGHFSLNPGVILNLNNGGNSYAEGHSYTGSNIPTSFSDDRTYHLHYLSVPVYLVYKTYNDYNEPHWMFGIGPSANFAIGGRYKQEYKEVSHGRTSVQRYNYSMPFGNNARFDRARGFDLGANVFIGYQMSSGFYFKAQYGLGLLNIAPQGNANNSLRNSGASVSVGFKWLTIRKNPWS